MNKFGYVLATKKLVEEKKKVRFMYHEAGSNPQDSGWRFFCGEEDDEYVGNPDNIAVYDIETILEIDRSVLPYLKCPEGTALERKNEDEPFLVSDAFGHPEGE